MTELVNSEYEVEYLNSFWTLFEKVSAETVQALKPHKEHVDRIILNSPDYFEDQGDNEATLWLEALVEECCKEDSKFDLTDILDRIADVDQLKLYYWNGFETMPANRNEVTALAQVTQEKVAANSN